MGINEAKDLIIITSIIFLTAPIAIVTYILVYNQKKRKFFEEKDLLKKKFEEEILKTQSEVREQTLQTIGADLHDNIGQLLSLSSLTLHSINLEDKNRATIKIDTAQAIITQAIKEMRALGQFIQGDNLVNLGLVKAIENQLGWVEKSGRFEVEFIRDGEAPSLTHHGKDLFIFRMIQEILNNIIKHSQAKKIKIKIRFSDKAFQLYMEDNGIGFDLDENFKDLPGMGLKNIDKRVEILGGNFNILSNLGKGTIINIFIPYP